MNFTLPKIYPITDVQLSGISHADQVEKLIAGGACMIQLRQKQGSPREFYKSAASALEIAKKSRVKIIINDRVDISLALETDGVHIGQDDLPPERARHILGPDAIIGFSTHSPEQALEALGLPIDYIAIGPIFQTRTKEDPDRPVGLEGLREVRRIIGDVPLVAIGGISADNLASVFEAGADSAAMIGALISDSATIAVQLQQFTNQFDPKC